MRAVQRVHHGDGSAGRRSLREAAGAARASRRRSATRSAPPHRREGVTVSIRGTRWGKKVPGTPSEAQTLLLEATGRVVERRGVARTTLADIAAEAGVTRPTV